jgi:hypothetical protein
VNFRRRDGPALPVRDANEGVLKLHWQARYNISAVTYLDWLEQTLATKLASKPVGEPVALRAYLQLTSDHGLLAPTAAAAVALAQRWFGAPPLSLYAQGGAEDGYVSVLATFTKGQTALISSDLVRGGAEPCGESPKATLVLLGNHGSMQFSDSPGSDGLPADLAPPRGAPQQQILRLIQESLREGKPAS